MHIYLSDSLWSQTSLITSSALSVDLYLELKSGESVHLLVSELCLCAHLHKTTHNLCLSDDQFLGVKCVCGNAGEEALQNPF